MRGGDGGVVTEETLGTAAAVALRGPVLVLRGRRWADVGAGSAEESAEGVIQVEIARVERRWQEDGMGGYFGGGGVRGGGGGVGWWGEGGEFVKYRVKFVFFFDFLYCRRRRFWILGLFLIRRLRIGCISYVFIFVFVTAAVIVVYLLILLLFF